MSRKVEVTKTGRDCQMAYLGIRTRISLSESARACGAPRFGRESRHVSLLFRRSHGSHIQEQYMARFSRLKVLNTMIDTGLVPVFYHPNLEVARQRSEEHTSELQSL